MNTNFFHNLINIALTVIGGLEVMDWNLLAPDVALTIVGALGATKLVMNSIRDGLSGLVKTQPPVV
jgi:uncharacterized MnhB-related membrane protein